MIIEIPNIYLSLTMLFNIYIVHNMTVEILLPSNNKYLYLVYL